MKTDATSLIHQLSHALGDLEDAPVECDGYARLATTILNHLGIEHTVYCGSAAIRDASGELSVVPYHFWLVRESDQGPVLIDYRLRMWLGEAAPHGVFEATRTDKGFAVGDYEYTGKPIDTPILPDNLFALLATDFDLPSALARARTPICG